MYLVSWFRVGAYDILRLRSSSRRWLLGILGAEIGRSSRYPFWGCGAGYELQVDGIGGKWQTWYVDERECALVAIDDLVGGWRRLLSPSSRTGSCFGFTSTGELFVLSPEMLDCSSKYPAPIFWFMHTA